LSAPIITASPPGSPHAALFYTGGADSGCALQQLHSQIRYAVFVEGFEFRSLIPAA